jgi:hypothetical protein
VDILCIYLGKNLPENTKNILENLKVFFPEKSKHFFQKKEKLVVIL